MKIKYSWGNAFDHMALLLLDKIYHHNCNNNPMDKTMLCSFEGICGAGKSTQLSRLSSLLSENGLDVGYFHIPAYDVSKTSKFLKVLYRRHKIFENIHKVIPSLNLFLIMLDFWELTQHYYKKSSEKHFPDVMLFSRGLLSTYVYNVPILQDFYTDFNKAMNIGKAYCKYLWKPDLIFYFEIQPETASDRILQTRKICRYNETIDGLRVSHNWFKRILDEELKEIQIVSVDATLPIDQITGLLKERITELSLSKSRFCDISKKLNLINEAFIND